MEAPKLNAAEAPGVAEDAAPATLAARAAPQGRLARLLARVHSFRERHKVLEHAAFFLGGFTFDVSVLDRIDHVPTLIQHGAYLVALLVLVLVDQRHALVGDLPAWLVKRLGWAENVTHFLLGTLLNAFTVFYFKSASGLTAFLFLSVLFVLLALNELPRLRARGPVVRVALYSFCITSYLAYLFPVIAGYLGRSLFVLAAACSSGVVGVLAVVLGRWRPDARDKVRRALLPAAAMQALLVALYLLKLLPPVPLAVQFMGIYHQVDVQKDGSYRLLHQRPEWKFWQHGDTHFLAREGDRIYCFVRVFAPHRFKHRIRIHWFYDDPSTGWSPKDAIELPVVGGRDQGFRGYAYKKIYEPGQWRVDVETDDGRDIGSLRFTLEKDTSTDERHFKVDRG